LEAEPCLLYDESAHRHFGSLWAAGAALGAGKRVYLVNKSEPAPFLECHPRCKMFRSLPEAITALMSDTKE